MLDSGVPRRTCIGAVANESDEAVKGSWVVGLDVILFDELGGLFECVSDDESVDSVVSDGRKDATFVALGDPDLELNGFVGRFDGWNEGTDGGHRVVRA